MKVSFRNRIALLFVLLVALVQGTGFFVLSLAARQNVMERADEALRTGGRVFKQLIVDRGAQLSQNVRVLTSDFAFKRAVATRDMPTISSVLVNHSGRVHADVAMLVSLDRTVTASTLGTPAQPVPFPYPNLLGKNGAHGTTADVVLFGGKPFQLVVAPVYAPLRIGWVAMGFEMDETLAQTLKELTHLDVSFVAGGNESQPALVTTLPDTARGALLGRERHGAGAFGAVQMWHLGGEGYLTLSLPLVAGQHGSAWALVQTSLSTALEPYRHLKFELLLLAGGTLALFLLGALLVARGVTRPVRELAQAARRLESGDYSRQAPVRGDDELGELAIAFNHMQLAIGDREARIIHHAWHDGLTDLPNRTLGRERLAKALVSAEANGTEIGVLLMDLNRFKEINDSLGHGIGDEVLKIAANRLVTNVRPADTVARLGGDEFMVMLMDAGEAATLAAARKLAECIAAPTRAKEITLYLETSIGMALFPRHGADVETLLRRADIAMYEAKQARTRFMLYRDGSDEQHLNELALMNDFRTAIAHGQLCVHYQPKAALGDGTVSHAEALVRWQHPERGMIYPDQFIPLAEQSGNIRWLTEWMLETVISQLRNWSTAGVDLSVSVNLSALDLMDPGLADRVAQALRNHAVHPGSLVLEVTESAVMRDAHAAVALLARLKSMGVRIAIDDFGTGYSSLSQLRRLPADELKIDKAFVLNLTADSEDAAIIRSTIELGHSMGLSVIAEGVETAESWSLLRQLQCDMAQGFLISKPLPAAEFTPWLNQYRQTRAAANRTAKGEGVCTHS